MSLNKPAQSADALTNARIIDILHAGVGCYRQAFGPGWFGTRWTPTDWRTMLNPLQASIERIPCVARLVIHGEPTDQDANFLVTFDDGSESIYRTSIGKQFVDRMFSVSVRRE